MKQLIDIPKLLQLVDEVEKEDPIDWGMLEIDEFTTRNVIALGVVDMFETTWLNDSLEHTHNIMLATIIKLVMENFALNAMLYEGGYNGKNG